MLQRSRTEIESISTVMDAPVQALPPLDLLRRWVDLLDSDPARVLNSLPEIEYRPAWERAATRCSDSPLTIAFADPVLREQGLRGDTLGDAMPFFGLSEHEAHELLCSCMNGGTMRASAVASRIRGMIRWRSAKRQMRAIFATLLAPFGRAAPST